MPYPKKRERMDPKDYERVPVNAFVTGIIEDVQYEEKHEFKGLHARVDEAVRFVFKIDGLKFKHYSRWMSFFYGDKANLFQKYILQLVHGAKPNMEFDIDQLKGMRIKMIWQDDPKNPDYQVIQLIVPEKDKIVPLNLAKPGMAEVHGNPDEEEVPF